MKLTLQVLISLLILFNNSFSQENFNSDQKVLLRWKIPGDYLAFKTTSYATEDKGIAFDWNKLAEVFPVVPDSMPEDFRLNFPSSSEVIIILKPINDAIQVKFILHSMDSVKNENEIMNKMMKSLMEKAAKQKVQLRGTINSSGEVLSFWLPQPQKNLLLSTFQLPRDSVMLGDEWEINTSLLEMRGDFICDDAKRISKAKLLSVKKEDGDMVAEIEYYTEEEVKGRINNPFNNNETDNYMIMTSKGRAEFYVDKGYWKKTFSLSEMKSEGMFNMYNLTNATMTPVSEIPEEYLELE